MMSQFMARMKYAVTAISMVAFLAAPAEAQPQLAEQAGVAARRGDWESTISLYEELLSTNAFNGEHWHNYGYAHHSLGNYNMAIAAFTKSIDLGFQPTHDMDSELRIILRDLLRHRERIESRREAHFPDIRWDGTRSASSVTS